MDKLAQETFENFFAEINHDPRIGSMHIAVYVTLFHQWIETGYQKDMEITSAILMEKCKISSTGTYHRAIRALHEFGYIRYRPSYNVKRKSTVCLLV